MEREHCHPGLPVSFAIEPIAIVRSCFKEKFGIPRQPGLTPSARGQLELVPPYNRPEAVRGLEGFSHLWLLFLFHGIEREGWQPTVRPPRLGGNERVGVFASRSTHRPNGIGLSVVELERIELNGEHVVLHVKGLDLLDGTPIVDIKPYLPYADAIPAARAAYATAPPERLAVSFTAAVQAQLNALLPAGYPELEQLLCEVLSFDHRPAYQREPEGVRIYGMHLYDLNVTWRYTVDGAEVVGLEPTVVTDTDQ